MCKPINEIVIQTQLQYFFLKRMDCLGKFIMMIAPAVACGDEATDIYYIVSNWNEFANPALKACSIVFVVLPFVIILLLQICRQKPRVNFIVDTFLIWTKIQEWIYFHQFNPDNEILKVYDAYTTETVDKQYDQTLKRFSSMKMLKYQYIIELFLEDLPQCICQTINNNRTSWSNWDRLSIILSISMLVFGTFILLYRIIAKGQRTDSMQMIHRQAYKQKADDLSRNVINSNY